MGEYMGSIGLPVLGGAERKLKCGCVRTVVSYPFATVTETDIADDCSKHAIGVRRSRAGMSLSRRFSILKRDGFTCQYCGRSAPNVELHVDHIVPVSRGGVSDDENLITACADCNIGKRDD